MPTNADDSSHFIDSICSTYPTVMEILQNRDDICYSPLIRIAVRSIYFIGSLLNTLFQLKFSPLNKYKSFY